MSKLKIIECACALVAAGAASVAGKQFYEGQELQAQNLAYQSWERFLEFSVENPEIAKGYQNYNDMKAEQREVYEKYVDRFLVSAELIMIAEPDDSEWQAAMIAEAKRHYSYLTSEDFLPRDPLRAKISGYCAYDKNVRNMIKRSMSYGARGSGYSSNFEAADKNCTPFQTFDVAEN